MEWRIFIETINYDYVRYHQSWRKRRRTIDPANTNVYTLVVTTPYLQYISGPSVRSPFPLSSSAFGPPMSDHGLTASRSWLRPLPLSAAKKFLDSRERSLHCSLHCSPLGALVRRRKKSRRSRRTIKRMKIMRSRPVQSWIGRIKRMMRSRPVQSWIGHRAWV